ncbi:dead end protein-like 1 [Sigmodon hispidus]
MQSKRECEQSCEKVNPENKAALEAWVRETGIRLVQVNRQRKYGGPPPGWVGSPLPSGSKVFVGRLPQDVYEHQLIPFFQRVGHLCTFCLVMMTFSGLNHGFAYARYSSRRGAQAAIATLHNHQLRPSCQLLVCRSTEKSELIVDGLLPTLNRHSLLLALQPMGPCLWETLLLLNPELAPSQIAPLKFTPHHRGKSHPITDGSHTPSQREVTLHHRGKSHSITVKSHTPSQTEVTLHHRGMSYSITEGSHTPS